MLFKPTKVLSPSAYPWAYDALVLSTTHAWTWLEVNMAGDLLSFTSLPQADKFAIQRILQGFAQLELRVQDYWSDVVARNIKAFDIVAMARQYGAQESIHAHAYNYLQSSLGLPISEDFLDIPEVADKLGLFSNCPADQLGKSIALFSGAAEGVSLFGSFAILLSYSSMKGLAQILSWSIRDENLHCNSGIRLYHQLVEEEPDQAISASELYDYFDKVLANELAFVASAFKLAEPKQGHGPALLNITLAEAEAFLRLKANQRIYALGFDKEHYSYDRQLADKIEAWFVPIAQGTTYQDFFSQQHNGSAYSASAGSALNKPEVIASLASMFG